MFTDEQVEAAVRALSDPERFAGAERSAGGDRARSCSASSRTRSTRAAGSATRTSRRCARRSPSPTTPAGASAIETLLAEETRMGMLVGVAVGWELARELDATTTTTKETETWTSASWDMPASS